MVEVHNIGDNEVDRPQVSLVKTYVTYDVHRESTREVQVKNELEISSLTKLLAGYSYLWDKTAFQRQYNFIKRKNTKNGTRKFF